MVISGKTLLKALRKLIVPATPEEVAEQIGKKSKKKYQLLLQEVREGLATGARLRYFNSKDGVYFTSGTKKTRRKDVLKTSESSCCQCPSHESVTNDPPINHVHNVSGSKISIATRSVLGNRKNNCSVEKETDDVTLGSRKRRKPSDDSGIAPKRRKLTSEKEKQISHVGLDGDPTKCGFPLNENDSIAKILTEDIRLKVHAIAGELGMIRKGELMSKSNDKVKSGMSEDFLARNIMEVLQSFIMSQNEPGSRENTVLRENIKNTIHHIVEEYVTESVFNDGPDAVDKSPATFNSSKMFRPYLN